MSRADAGHIRLQRADLGQDRVEIGRLVGGEFAVDHVDRCYLLREPAERRSAR
jgi:hypothetical protein